VFDALKDAFSKTFDRISGKGKLKEGDVASAAREIKLALLAADVHYAVVKDFIDRVAAKAVGRDVLDSITPEQQFTKIVHDELISALGKEHRPFDFAVSPPLVVMMVGLQGSGKTTTAARFAKLCKSLGRRPYLIPADVRRPAAVEQLITLAAQAGVDAWNTDVRDDGVKVVKHALKHASKVGYDTVIIDTAGRLHIDREMMDEVKEIAKRAGPQRILYVADSMTGQDAVRSAKAFDEELAITGVVLTKIDGDARGGAALSIAAVTGKPIIYVGTGEGLNDFEPFHPERMAGRILGRGDIVSLVEKVEAKIEEGDKEAMESALRRGAFTFDDYIKQLKMIRRMGPLTGVISMIPGLSGLADKVNSADLERELRRKEAMIQSMTIEERVRPTVLNGSRRKRIAKGSGVDVSELNRFLKEFDAFSAVMKKFSKGGMKNLFKLLT
jgi:signal recognition particle subunit SRP54